MRELRNTGEADIPCPYSMPDEQDFTELMVLPS